MRIRFVLALLVFPVVALTQPAFQEKVTVSYVEIPVTVTGRDGGSVRGLTRENFEVYEDGRKRAIESFEAVDFASRDSIKAISPLNPVSRRNFLLLFDLSFANPTSIRRAQDAAREFVTRRIGLRDLVSIGVVDVNSGFRFLTAFTTDRNLLLAAVADPATFRTVDPLQIAGINPFQITQETGGPSGDVSERRSVAQENFADAARALSRMDDAYLRGRVRKQVESLGEIAHALKNLAGRKHLVLLSEGFDPRLVQGRSAAEVKEQAEENAFVASGEGWKVDSDRRFGNASAQMSIKLMADEFRRADVVLHAVDIKGVRVQNDVLSGAKVNSNEGLFLLANPTGGTVFRNSNSISADFDRLTRQHEVVYVLGFRAPAGKPGRLHDLKVKLINVPRARAQHRDGYYEPGEEIGVGRSLSAAEVILNDIPQTDLDVAAMAAAFPGPGDKAQVPVVLEIRGDDLVKSARDSLATTDIFVYAFDEEGLVRDSLIDRVALDVTKAASHLRGRGIRFYGTLHLPPGRYAVRSLVRVSETDRRGYKRLDLAVPAPGEVAVVPPIFLAGPQAGEWVMVKSSRDTAATPYPFVLDGESFIPAANTTVAPGESHQFAVFVYNAASDEITFEITPEAKLVSTTEGDAVTKYVFTLGNVPVHVTELDVTIRKKGSSDSRKVSVPIRAQ